jgi:hypothetical protein
MKRISTYYVAVGLAAAGLATFSACASTPLRTETSTSGIRAAEEVGAANVPRAALHLQLAKEELVRAEALAASGRGHEGASWLLRAEADAELSLALSRADAEKTEARAAVARVQQLRKENQPLE